MPRFTSLWLVPCLLLSVSLLTTAPRAATLAAFEPTTRQLYVTATDSKGVPITDLTAADIQVKENGKDREVSKVEPASETMTVAIMVQDNLTVDSGVRKGLFAFVQSTFKNAQTSLIVTGLKNNAQVDYTSDGNKLVAGINSLTMAPVKEEAHIAEGIFEVAKELKARKVTRSAIVVACIHSTQISAMSTDQVLNALRDAGSVMYAIVVPGGTTMATSLGQMGDTEGSDKVLGDGPKQSGGRQIEIEGSTLGFEPRFQNVADELMHQFVVTYTLPDGVKPDNKVSVSTKRKGINLHAPTRIPA